MTHPLIVLVISLVIIRTVTSYLTSGNQDVAITRRSRARERSMRSDEPSKDPQIRGYRSGLTSMRLKPAQWSMTTLGQSAWQSVMRLRVTMGIFLRYRPSQVRWQLIPCSLPILGLPHADGHHFEL
jgi:hypothetical protein